MYLGQIMEIATTKALFEHPRHPYTRALIASIPTPNFDLVEPAVVSQDSDGDIVQERLIKGELPSPNDPPEGCPFKTRCEKATEQCDIKPPLAKMNDGRLISCHFPD
jgi:oligopeptide transport system ATP-binding protein